MIKDIIIFGSPLVLGFIFLRRYLMTVNNISLRDLLFRKKNLFHHEPDSCGFELTADEIIPARDESDTKKLARADSFLKKADIQLHKGDLHAAEKFLIQALSFDPSAIDAYKKLGMIYLRQAQFGKAESIYKKLVSTITDDPSFFSNLGMALYSQKKLEEAKKFYKKAIEIDSGRAGRFFSLGQILYELGETEEALNNFRKAIEMDGENLDYLLTMAHFYIDKEMIPDARQHLSEILRVFPENEEAQAMLQKLG